MKKIVIVSLLCFTTTYHVLGMEQQPGKIQRAKQWIASWFVKQPSLEQQKAQLLAVYDVQIERVDRWLQENGTPDDISGETRHDMYRFSKSLLRNKQDLMTTQLTPNIIKEHTSLLKTYQSNIDFEYTPEAIQRAQKRKQDYIQEQERIRQHHATLLQR